MVVVHCCNTPVSVAFVAVVIEQQQLDDAGLHLALVAVVVVVVAVVGSDKVVAAVAELDSGDHLLIAKASIPFPVK